MGELPQPTLNTDFYDEALLDLRLTTALKQIWQEIRGLNLFLQDKKPWEVVKQDKAEFSKIILTVISNILLIADLLDPFLPDSAKKIKATFADGKVHPEVGLLFPPHQ